MNKSWRINVNTNIDSIRIRNIREYSRIFTHVGYRKGGLDAPHFLDGK